MQKTKLIFRNRSMELGGVENVLLSIVNALDKTKYDITILLTFRRGEFLDRIPKEVKVLSVTGDSEKLPGFKIPSIIHKVYHRLKYISFQKYPTKFYKKHGLMDTDYEIAFSNTMYSDILNSPNKKSKKICWFHADLRNFWISENRKLKIIEQMKRFDKRVFVSEFSKNGIENYWKIQLGQTEIINNILAVDEIMEKANLKPERDFGKINFLAIGRLQQNKGFKDLIKAHSKLIQDGFNIRTLILGKGYQYAELKELIDSEKVSDSIILGGYQSNPYPYLENADCFVLSSYSEGYSLVVAEALLLNTPVIATKVGAVEEMVESEKIGLLYEPGAENLYRMMKRVSENQTEFSRNSSESIKQKNEQILKNINNLFK